MAAWLVLALAAGPMADLLICNDDTPAASAGQSLAAADHGDLGGKDGPSAPGEIGDLCQHGHCHHGGPLIAAVAPMVSADLTGGLSPYPAASETPPSQIPQGLLRPPRA